MDIGVGTEATTRGRIHGAARRVPHIVSTLRRRWRLAFPEAGLERAFQEQYFRDNVGHVRAGHVLVIAAWTWFGVLLAVVGSGPGSVGIGLHLVIALVAGIGITSASLAMTFLGSYAGRWQVSIVVLLLVTAVLSQLHRIVIGHAAGWDGVVASIVVLGFTYAVFRLQFRYAALGGILVLVSYNLTRILFPVRGDIGLLVPDIYFVAFVGAGTASAFALERIARSLFVRQREVERERERGDALLLSILPGAIVHRLKTRGPSAEQRRIAERYPDVSVLFADLVGFTAEAADLEPDELIVTLDRVFADWDELADRLGLEKIKTMGDAYLAVAGVPEVRADHVAAAARMGLAMRDGLSRFRWPSGAAMSARIGIACGPVVAGVIGHRKFAYDIWGDTVNTASRFESAAAPGSILVSHVVYQRLSATHAFSKPRVVELKGKGATTAHTLLGRLPTAGRVGAGQPRPVALRAARARTAQGSRSAGGAAPGRKLEGLTRPRHRKARRR